MKKKIKLLLVSSVFGDRGVERIMLFLYTSLPKDTYEIKILCLRNLSPYADYLNKNTDITVDVTGMKNNLDFAALFRFYRYIKKFKPDIINFHSFRAALWGRLIARIAKVPVVLYSVHNKWGGAVHHFLDRSLSRLTDAIVPFSTSVKNYLLYEEKIPAKFVENPIYIGIDIKKFSDINEDDVKLLRQELGIKEGQNIIGFVGSISKQKGLIYLIESVRKLNLNFPDLRCLIIGEGSEEETLRKIIVKYKLENNFTFMGQRYDIYNLLHVMKIFVLPSLWEGLPQVVIEALAASCPVIATNVNGTPEIIAHKKNGWLVPPADAEELSKAIELLLSDKVLRKELAENGFETARDKFSVETMTENYNNLYQSYFRRL
ncbi:MAG: glycosyltransferase [Nitrospirae bacterium]|nr:glycosyltransferase [Nitrospirota bacterium]